MSGFLHRALGGVERTARKLRERSSPPGGFADLEMHLWMLADEVRAQAFEAAIQRTVTPGDVVVDVGTGTGLLAMMACRAGAARVYAIEETEVHRLARTVIDANGFSGKIEVLHGRSTALDLPERADVVVSETIGSFVFSEGVLPTLFDARRRFLKEGGGLIPGRIRVFMTPVESHAEGIGFWERPVRGFDYMAARDHLAFDTPMAARKIGPGNHLAGRQLLYDVDFTVDEEGFRFDRTVSFTALREGRLHGFLGTWEAVLHSEVTLACDPSGPPVHWPPILFRLREGLTVRPGQRIILKFVRRDPPGWRWKWDAEVQGEQSDH